MVGIYRSFPMDSWLELLRVYGNSCSTPLPFRDYQHFFPHQVVSLTFGSTRYPRLVTFHRRLWLRVWPQCPGSTIFPLNSHDLLLPILIEYFRKHGLFFPVSSRLNSTGPVRIWRALWPELTPLDSTYFQYSTSTGLTLKFRNFPSSSIA